MTCLLWRTAWTACKITNNFVFFNNTVYTFSIFGAVHELEISAKERLDSKERLQPREQDSFGKKGNMYKFLSSVQTAVDQSLDCKLLISVWLYWRETFVMWHGTTLGCTHVFLSMLLTGCGWSLHLGEENVVDLPNVAFAVSGIHLLSRVRHHDRGRYLVEFCLYPIQKEQSN